MKEWNNPYNSFNSYKGLLYKDQFDGMISGKFLPPIEVNIDPVNNCQLFCKWCNGIGVIDRKNDCKMTSEHLLDIVRFCKEWGVKAICFAGGGEPTMHESLADAIDLTNSLGMESAIITNGLFKDFRQIQAVSQTRWCGISVDCATPETYIKCKGYDGFSEVLVNILKLVSLGTKEVTYKYLVHPDNQHEIYEACKLARGLGCNTFHCRLLSGKYTQQKFDYALIKEQLEKCHELQTEHFNVFTISHKQDGEDNRRIRFDKCKASPLLCMFEANGTTSVCIDRKGDERTTLCRHDNLKDVLNMWGSEKHKELLDKICPHTDCSKCTMTIYQELLEAYKSDKFCRNFP